MFKVRRALISVSDKDGIVPFVANRVMLLCFDVHAVPVDDLLRAHLVDAGAADEELDVTSLASWLGRQIKSADGLHRFRRITQITEVRKGWQDDPLLENGFVAEVQSLLDAGYAPELPSLSAIGYRQIIQYLEGEIDLEEAILKKLEVNAKRNWDAEY